MGNGDQNCGRFDGAKISMVLFEKIRILPQIH